VDRDEFLAEHTLVLTQLEHHRDVADVLDGLACLAPIAIHSSRVQHDLLFNEPGQFRRSQLHCLGSPVGVGGQIGRVSGTVAILGQRIGHVADQHTLGLKLIEKLPVRRVVNAHPPAFIA